MNYLVCAKCRYETREVSDVCRKCGQGYVCDWDPAWYQNRFTLASTGRSRFARTMGTVYVVAAFLFGIAVLGANVALDADQQDWTTFSFFMLLLAFCTWEVSSFTRGKPTILVEGFMHDGVPRNTGWRVVGLCVDVMVSVWAGYRLLLPAL